jgi:hypothetical protein
MLTDIQNKILKLRITVKWWWIWGDQDENVAFSDLDEWGQANVLVDNVVKAYWNHLNARSHEPLAQRFADEEWSFYKYGEKRARWDKSLLYQELVKEKVLIKKVWKNILGYAGPP